MKKVFSYLSGTLTDLTVLLKGSAYADRAG